MELNNGVVNNGSSGNNDLDLDDAKALDGSEILLKLAGTTATVENNNGCVIVEDKSATITCPGDYYITGESSDFQVVVNTPAVENEGNTGIHLYNATLKSLNSPILVKNAAKAVLHLAKGTTNVVEDGNGDHLYVKINGTQDTAKAAIYARDDLNIKGAGSLFVTGNFRNGIQSSNDLKIKNGNITVVAADNGIKGKGSLEISGGTLNITATAGDGLESDECIEAVPDSCTSVVEGKGIINIPGGLIDTDAGYEITGGVLLAFGDFTTDVPKCDVISYTSDSYYGSDVAAFKPQYHGKMILYGGAVTSVGMVETAGMQEIKFPNGVSYKYK